MTPEPQQRAIEVPEEKWIARAGWAQMAKRAIANGYRVRLTYSRGWMPGATGDLTHGLLLRIYEPGNLTPSAAAWWWAKAGETDTDNLSPAAKYAFKGAMIVGQPWKATSTELTAWLTREKETTDD